MKKELNMLKIRKTRTEDLGDVEKIFIHARKMMKLNGNPTQWGDSRPSMSLVEKDIANGDSYVVTEDERIAATFAFIIGTDPTYLNIEEGRWFNNLPYGTIHRIASDNSVKGIFPFVIRWAKRFGIDIRIDTHKDNSIMIHQIEKQGFRYCGIITVDDGTKRNAYQLLRKVLVIAGPTAVGKTDFAIAVAKQLDGEIISGDSIQVYKGLDIGSAKADLKQRSEVPHYLIDIKEPSENYSVKEFQELGRRCIDDIGARKRLPIICGGTGLYIKACLYDFTFFDEDTEDDPYESLTNEEIYNRLKEVDPDSLQKIHVNNRKRLVRALNVYEKHSKGISAIRDEQQHRPIYDCLVIGLTDEREKLYQRIDERIDGMIDNGLVDEIKELLNKGVSFDDQSMQGIGYKEFRAYFEKERSIEECIQEVKRNTHHFVKRQYTYFNHQFENIEWFADTDEAEKRIKEWYRNEIQ